METTHTALLAIIAATCCCLLPHNTRAEEACNATSSSEIWNATTLRVTWSGQLDENSSVSVEVSRMCGAVPTCNETTSDATIEFRSGSLEFPIERDAVYSVQVSFSSNCSQSWIVPVPAGVPNLKVSIKTNTSVHLGWDPFLDPLLEQRVSYVIRLNSTAYTTENTSYNIRKLDPYTEYTFRIFALFDVYPQLHWTDELTVRTDPGVPYAPTDLNWTSVGNTTVGLSWQAPAVSTGPIVEYQIHYRNSKSEIQERNTRDNNTHFEVDGLVPYELYIFNVAASTEAGPGNWSEDLAVQTEVGIPYAPTGLNTKSVTNTTMEITWEAPDMSTGPILMYRIRYQDSGGQVEIRDTNDTSYEVHGLAPYEWYILAVVGRTEAGYGNWSEDLEVQTKVGVPHAPTDLNWTSVGNTTIGLSWQAPAVSTGPIVEYQIHYRNSKSEIQERNTRDNNTHFEVDGLDSYEWYIFNVAARTEAGRGNWSENLEVRTAVGVPYAPTALTTTFLTNTTVGLTWEAPVPCTGPVLSYHLQWENANGERYERDTGGNQTWYRVDRLAPYVWYTFAVSAQTAAGRGEWSRELQVRTEIGVPPAPTGLNSTSVGNTTVGLTWEAPAISTGPILEYRILYQIQKGQIEKRDTNDTSYEITGLSPYQWYTFAVMARTLAGYGNRTEELEIRTDIGVPYAPTDLNSTSVGNTTVGLTWESPFPSTGPILMYQIRYKNSEGQSGERDTNDTSCEVDGLAPYQWYTFVVGARTEAGQGNGSEELKVRTEIGVPYAPTGLSSTSVGNTTVVLTWEAPDISTGPILEYRIRYRDSKGRIQNRESKDTSYKITGLSPYEWYTFAVVARTVAGLGNWSEDLELRTEVGVPRPATIRHVSIQGKGAARVKWVTSGPYPGPVAFSLQAWKYPDPCSGKVSPVADKEVKGIRSPSDWSTAESTSIDELTPYALYSFVVLLKTTASDGVGSQLSDIVRMPAQAPDRPQNVALDCRWSSTRARVSWSPPLHPNGKIVRYVVRYSIVGQSEVRSDTVDVSDLCSNQSHVIYGMRPERRYRVTVSASVQGVDEEGQPGSPRGFCELPAGIPFLGNTSRLLATSSAPLHVTLEWTEDTFSDYMGDITWYSVLVGNENAFGESMSGKNGEENPPWSNFSSGGSDFYQATPIGWNPFRTGYDPLECQNTTIEEENNRTLVRCTVGGQWPCPDNETYCNGPLRPDTSYELKIRAFTRGGYNETELLRARTSPLPEKSRAGAVAAAVLSVVLLAALATGCYVMKSKGMLAAAWSKLQSARGIATTTGAPSDQEMQQSKNSRPIPTRNFSDHVRRMMSDSHLQFSQEFEELKLCSPQLPCTVAESEENRPKNRWMNIFPFDHSRVKLLPLCDEPGSDFINASYIPGPSSPREYIASQGPLPHTVDDFWRMAWEQSVSTVVMLTQCTERGKKKCEPYWPPEGRATHYGDLSVATVSESMLATHVIRVLRLQLGSYERQVKQIHFMHWPDFGCPDRPEDLIEFVGAVRDHLPRRNPGPILVHCSAGVGRTGTFIAVDRLRREVIGSAQEVDIYGTVLELRQHRTNMVQTEDQYIYIHLCVERLVWARDHPHTAENIYSNVEELDTSF